MPVRLTDLSLTVLETQYAVRGPIVARAAELEKAGRRVLYGNIGNPINNFAIRDLADMMLKLAGEYPEYRDSAKKVKIVETTSDAYYGKGYQDVQNRVPKITNTCEELGWKPTTTMADTLRKIFDAYRTQIAEARGLVD